MDQRDCILTLYEINGIGIQTIRALCESIPDLNEIFEMREQEICRRTGIEMFRAKLIAEHFQFDLFDQIQEKLHQSDVQVLTILDEAYPTLLKQIEDPPPVLYYRGNLSFLKLPAIAMVGTRTPTLYGMKGAIVFARSIAAHGVTVISGLARGIDAHAHKAALGQPGRTIAVMATGFNRIYPTEHIRLEREIEEHGLVITEIPLHLSARIGSFPRRNRIIAGLADATLVVEASKHSGSLITSSFAARYGRPVCTIPSNIFSVSSEGNQDLIHDGAIPVSTVAELFEACNWRIEMRQENTILGLSEALTSEEEEVLRILAKGAMTVDELFQYCKFSLGHLYEVLLSLQMRNLITSLTGSHFISLRE
jgi:DNA processing protein